MQIETDGLVIMERQVGESDRLITVLTREEGVLRAFARKAKLLRSSKLSATQLLCYSRFLIYKGRDKYIIDDAQPVEVFFDLRRDIGSLSLAPVSYTHLDVYKRQIPYCLTNGVQFKREERNLFDT